MKKKVFLFAPNWRVLFNSS